MWFHVFILDPVCSDPEVLTSVCVDLDSRGFASILPNAFWVMENVVLFRGSKRVTVKEDDMTTEQMVQIFQVL